MSDLEGCFTPKLPKKPHKRLSFRGNVNFKNEFLNHFLRIFKNIEISKQ